MSEWTRGTHHGGAERVISPSKGSKRTRGLKTSSDSPNSAKALVIISNGHVLCPKRFAKIQQTSTPPAESLVTAGKALTEQACSLSHQSPSDPRNVPGTERTHRD